jgi:hypothetical protein
MNIRTIKQDYSPFVKFLATCRIFDERSGASPQKIRSTSSQLKLYNFSSKASRGVFFPRDALLNEMKEPFLFYRNCH